MLECYKLSVQLNKQNRKRQTLAAVPLGQRDTSRSTRTLCLCSHQVNANSGKRGNTLTTAPQSTLHPCIHNKSSAKRQSPIRAAEALLGGQRALVHTCPPHPRTRAVQCAQHVSVQRMTARHWAAARVAQLPPRGDARIGYDLRTGLPMQAVYPQQHSMAPATKCLAAAWQ